MRKNIKMMMTMMLAVCLCATSGVFAADGTRNTTTPGNWSDGGSWAGGTVASGSGSTAYFTNNITATIDTFVDTDTTIGNITVNDGDGTPNNNDIENGAGRLTLAGGSTIDCATRLNLKCVVDGTEGFTKTGAGLLNIGATSNLISGTVNLNGTGEILLNDVNALMNADVNLTTVVKSRKDQCNTKSITVGNGGRFDRYDGAGAVPIKATTSITVQNGGLLGTGLDSHGGSFDLLSPSITVQNGGKIQVAATAPADVTIGGSNITVESGGRIELLNTCNLYADTTIAGTGGANAWDAAIYCADNNRTINISNVTLSADARIGGVTIGNTVNLRGDIDGTGALTIHAQSVGPTAGYPFNIYGSNTYSGGTTISVGNAYGLFKLFGPQRLPNTALTFLHNVSKTQLDLNGHDQEVNSIMSQLATGAGAGDYIVELKDTAGGARLTSGNHVIVQDGTTLDISCDITCGGELIAGLGAGTGRINLNSGVDVKAGYVRVGLNDAQYPANKGYINLESGARLETAVMYSWGSVPVTGSGGGSYFKFDGGTLSDGSYGEVLGSFTNWFQPGYSNIVQAGGAKIEVNSASREIKQPLYHDADLGGTADGGLTKLGSGNLVLSAANEYTGPTIVSNGALIVNGTLASSGITLVSGTAIGGSGTIPGMTIPSGAKVSPGNSIDTLNTSGNLTMAAGSEYDWEVGDTSADEADLVNVGGTLDLGTVDNAITVNVIKVSGVTQPSDTMTLYTTTGVSGNADSIAMIYTGAISGPDHPTISGNDIVVTGLTPEPGTIGLLAILGLAFLRRK